MTDTQLSRKEARLYKKLRSGFTWHNTKWDIRFITLTSSTESCGSSLSYDWKRLVAKIRRLTPLRLFKSGYITEAELKRYYRSKPLMEPIQFEYCAVETDEGNGVIHAPCITSFIPQKWLQDEWIKIHSTRGVDIRWCKPKPRETREGGMRGLANYCLQKYLIGQRIVRSYTSRGWLKKGYAVACKRIWKLTRDKRHYVWLLTKWLTNECSEEVRKEIEHTPLKHKWQATFGTEVRIVSKHAMFEKKQPFPGLRGEPKVQQSPEPALSGKFNQRRRGIGIHG